MQQKWLLAILTVMIATASASYSPGQRLTALEARQAGVPSRSFTDTTVYNGWNHDHNPLGFLESGDYQASVKLGYRLHNRRQDAEGDSLIARSHGFMIPELMVGKPQAIYFGLRYERSALSAEQSGKLSLPLNRFGMTLAGQTPSGIFQIGVRGDGFFGTLTGDGTPDTRVIMGVDNIGIYLGSQVHELMRLNLWSRATAQFDTLYSTDRPRTEDRWYAGAYLPLFGWGLDFGAADFPVRSNLGFDIGQKHFVYVIKPGPVPGMQIDESGNLDPITTDTLRIDWKITGRIPLGETFLSPACNLGYWRSHYRHRIPTSKNYPGTYAGVRDGSEWKVSALDFGLGLNLDVSTFAVTWIEYARQTMRLTTGEAFSDPDGRDRQGYNRLGMGVEVPLHGIPAFSFPQDLECSLRLGQLIMSQNRRYNALRSEDFTLLTQPAAASQLSRYSPAGLLDDNQKVTHTSLGLHLAIADRMFTFDPWLGFMRLQSRAESPRAFNHRGLEIGLDAAYNLRKP